MKTIPGGLRWLPKRRKKGAPMHPPRPAESYRGARKRADRGNKRSLLLKEERLLTGETRREMDRRREAARQARELALAA